MPDSRLQNLITAYTLLDANAPNTPFIAADKRSDLPPGWFPLAQQLIEDLIHLGWDRRVLQIKEKWGSLRFYISQHDPPLVDLTIAAREKSTTICQECGEPGTWFEEGYDCATLCASCKARLLAGSRSG